MVWRQAKVFLASLSLVAMVQSKPVAKAGTKNPFPFNFQCVTDTPSTSFLFSEDGDHFKVELIHHRGTLYAPFANRLIVPNDMGDLLDAAEVAKNTGDDIEMRWDKSGCKRLNNEVFSCVGGGESLTSAKKQIKPWAISRTLVTTLSSTGESKKYTVNVSYDIQGKSFDYMMDYQLNECVVTR